MITIFNLSLTFLTALVGGALLFKLKVPGGMMVGAIVSVMILSITSGAAYMPSLAKAAAQCLAGAFIACGIGRNDLKNISKLTPSPRIWNVPRMWDSRITTSIFVVSNQLCGCCIKFKSDMKLHNLLNELSSGAWFGIGLSMLPYPDMKSYSSR